MVVTCLLALVVLPVGALAWSASRRNPTWPTSRVQAILGEMQDRAGDEMVLTVVLDRREVRMTSQSGSGQRIQTWSDGSIRESTSSTVWRDVTGLDLASFDLDAAVDLVRDTSTKRLEISVDREGGQPWVVLTRDDGNNIHLDEDMQPR